MAARALGSVANTVARAPSTRGARAIAVARSAKRT